MTIRSKATANELGRNLRRAFDVALREECCHGDKSCADCLFFNMVKSLGPLICHSEAQASLEEGANIQICL